MADYIRARSPEHKQERMEQIMAVTDALFVELPYSDITLSLIGKELGWSRANLYKYVSTKEEIFLNLHAAKNRAYLEDLSAALKDESMDDDVFARTWAEVTDAHASFQKYQSILVTVIEANVDLETLTQFKRGFARMGGPVHAILQRRTKIGEAQAHDLYLRLLYQATGLYNHFNCADLTREAMRLAGLPPVTGSFVDEYAEFVMMCLVDARGKGRRS